MTKAKLGYGSFAMCVALVVMLGSPARATEPSGVDGASVRERQTVSAKSVKAPAATNTVRHQEDAARWVELLRQREETNTDGPLTALFGGILSMAAGGVILGAALAGDCTSGYLNGFCRTLNAVGTGFGGALAFAGAGATAAGAVTTHQRLTRRRIVEREIERERRRAAGVSWSWRVTPSWNVATGTGRLELGVTF